MANEDIRRYTIEEIRERVAKGDYYETPPDAPTFELPDEFWDEVEKTFAERRRTRTSIHLRVKPDVLAFFKEAGPGHLTRMAEVLEAYANAKGGRIAPTPTTSSEPAE